jgi:hypothetical protein
MPEARGKQMLEQQLTTLSWTELEMWIWELSAACLRPQHTPLKTAMTLSKTLDTGSGQQQQPRYFTFFTLTCL